MESKYVSHSTGASKLQYIYMLTVSYPSKPPYHTVQNSIFNYVVLALPTGINTSGVQPTTLRKQEEENRQDSKVL